MKLSEFFEESAVHARQLVKLYDALDFKEKRTRSEWRGKLFGNNIVDWGVSAGVWRAVNGDSRIQIVGAESTEPFLNDLIAWRPMLLQYSLVMMLAAIDKTLHQATTSKRFAQQLKSGKLDDLIKNPPVSETYSIAMESRKRRGYGGKTKVRPAHRIREFVSARLYEDSFLSLRNLEKVCAANGVNKIFAKYATHLQRKSVAPLREQWSIIYRKRNALVHECNIVRTKISPKKIRFETVDVIELKKEIDFVEVFGKFLASKLG